MNDIVAVQSKALSAAEVRSHINLIQEVMRGVMKEGVHYGVIPGCKQPSLFKPGSEVLLTTFRIAISLEVEDLSDDDEIRYRVFATGTHQTTGTIVGQGVGECSTNEDKYKWRKAVCLEEFNDTSEMRRRIKYQKGGYVNGSYNKNAVIKIEQVRTEPSDLANTVLKMAKKRAQIDFTLTAMGASDIFTQDIEDIPEELRESGAEGTAVIHEHDGMKAATTVQELVGVMNKLSQDEKKRYLEYFNQRKAELTKE
jgi:hypothetical protein